MTQILTREQFKSHRTTTRQLANLAILAKKISTIKLRFPFRPPPQKRGLAGALSDVMRCGPWEN